MLKTIKLVLRDKLCAVIGVSSAFVMAVFSLLSSGLLRRVGGEWTISMKPLEFLAGSSSNANRIGDGTVCL
jgi:hypothetical protein